MHGMNYQIPILLVAAIYLSSNLKNLIILLLSFIKVWGHIINYLSFGRNNTQIETIYVSIWKSSAPFPEYLTTNHQNNSDLKHLFYIFGILGRVKNTIWIPRSFNISKSESISNKFISVADTESY